MKVLVIGGGLIGTALVPFLIAGGMQVEAVTKKELDLLSLPDDLAKRFNHPDVVYICAAKSRFIDCESNPAAYRVNVDAVLEIGLQLAESKIIYLSSEAVERGLHTAYGTHKALAEVGLRGVCKPVIARICHKVTHDEYLPLVCTWLTTLVHAKPGVHRWYP